MSIPSIIAAQRQYFATGATLPVQSRIVALSRLEKAIDDHEPEILAALEADLHKCGYEGYMTEIGMVKEELRFTLRHLGKWTNPRRVPVSPAQFPSKCLIYSEPYGVALIMAPWNYPFQLSIAPLIGAIAAGNCAVVKPSAYAPATSRIIAGIIRAAFIEQHVSAIEGGREENAALLEERFDYIFFTGSVEVGKLVMEKASRHLTPISLELGGKSPVIIDKSADLALCARRVAFGKLLNAGQTCVAPDYALVPSPLAEEFIEHYRRAVEEFFPKSKTNVFEDFPRIVNDKHFARLSALLDAHSGDIAIGGERDAVSRFIAPALIRNAGWDSPIMQQEIFGPILPVIPYFDLSSELVRVAHRPKPLALYLFSEDERVVERVLSTISFGGGCVNDTILHLTNSHMGFGGVGESGMGCYHGKHSFDAFTHYKSVMKKGAIDIPLRYRPYTKQKEKWLRRFM